MTYVVGLAGRAESGKSTAAEMLHSIVLPKNGYHIEFSEPIITMASEWMAMLPGNVKSKEALRYFRKMTDLEGDTLDKLMEAGERSPQLEQYMTLRNNLPPISAENKHLHRQLLEWLGKGIADHVRSTYWSERVIARTSTYIDRGADFITLSGIRSVYDAESARSTGAPIIRLARGGVVNMLPSETGIGSWEADYYLDNNGTLEDLHMSLRGIWCHVAMTHGSVAGFH